LVKAINKGTWHSREGETDLGNSEFLTIKHLTKLGWVEQCFNPSTCKAKQENQEMKATSLYSKFLPGEQEIFLPFFSFLSTFILLQ
jgi:hypothetical protein